MAVFSFEKIESNELDCPFNKRMRRKSILWIKKKKIGNTKQRGQKIKAKRRENSNGEREREKNVVKIEK